MPNIKVSLVIDSFFQKNQLFNEKNEIVNRDDCQRPWIELKKELETSGIDLNTVDITSIEEADIVMFVNIPDPNNSYFIQALELNKKLYCVITELDLIHKPNKEKSLTDKFTKIFTYQTQNVDNVRTFKLNYSFDFKKKYHDFKILNTFNKRNFCAIIAGNKSLKHDNELYSKRVEIIKWFGKHYKSELDLYGVGWNKFLFLRRIPFDYNWLGPVKYLLPDYFESYLGRIKKKEDVLNNYKFSVCFENAINVKGWITEKVFDPLFNGCIPIYLGAEEIESVIDKGCFIDMRNFADFQGLYNFLISVNESDYNKYLENIKKFLLEKANDADYEFGLPYFIKTIKVQILKDINND